MPIIYGGGKGSRIHHGMQQEAEPPKRAARENDSRTSEEKPPKRREGRYEPHTVIVTDVETGEEHVFDNSRKAAEFIGCTKTTVCKKARLEIARPVLGRWNVRYGEEFL